MKTHKTKAVALVIVGILLIASGAWFYKVIIMKYTPPGWKGSTLCGNHVYGVSPAFKGAKGEGKFYVLYSNGTVKTGSYTWHIYVLNDPCKENGTARVILRFEPSGNVIQRSVPLNQLYGVLQAPLDLLVANAIESSAVTGLGPTQAYKLETGPSLSPGLTPNTYYYQVASYYYNDKGFLVRIDSQRILASGPNNAPPYMRFIDTVNDFYSSTGPSGDYVSYSKSLNIISSASIIAGLYIVAGLLLAFIGIVKLLF